MKNYLRRLLLILSVPALLLFSYTNVVAYPSNAYPVCAMPTFNGVINGLSAIALGAHLGFVSWRNNNRQINHAMMISFIGMLDVLRGLVSAGVYHLQKSQWVMPALLAHHGFATFARSLGLNIMLGFNHQHLKAGVGRQYIKNIQIFYGVQLAQNLMEASITAYDFFYRKPENCTILPSAPPTVEEGHINRTICFPEIKKMNSTIFSVVMNTIALPITFAISGSYYYAFQLQKKRKLWM